MIGLTLLSLQTYFDTHHMLYATLNNIFKNFSMTNLDCIFTDN